MIQKEKAKELYDQFIPLTKTFDVELGFMEQPDFAKECAFICVDEIINTLSKDIQDINVAGNVLLDLIEYWQEVKKEIELL